MKKIKFVCLFVSLALMLCGCTNSGSTSQNSDNSTAPSYYEYAYKSSHAERFAVSHDGDIVVSTFNGTASELMKLSEDGTGNKLGECPGIPECMAFMGNELFVLKIRWNTSGTSDGITIYKINQSGRENEVYGEFDIPLEFGYSMCGSEDEIFIIGKDGEKGNINCDYPNFYDSKYSVFRISEGKSEKLPVDFPTAVCTAQGGGVLIAACNNNGYYIVSYKNGSLSEKMYAENIRYNINGIADVDGEHIVFNMMTTANKYMLCASDTENMSMTELIPGLNVNGDRLFAANGYCYFQPMEKNDKDEYAIERIRFSDYYKYNAPMSLICSQLSRSTPFGCGYTINVIQPSNEESALKILSQDRDYDMCYISTKDDIAYAIKSQGSFYPLNEVPGVSEYLDKCLPAIKEAFTGENGDIWGLPLYTDADFIFSNYGDTDFSGMKLDDFVDFMDSLSSEELDKTLCILSGFTADILTDYVIKHDSFDTAEFRAAAEKLKNSERLNKAKGGYTTSTLINSEEQLMSLHSNSVIYNYDRDFKVSGIPCISEPNVLIPDVIFLSVNPNSEHLNDALDYIEKLTQYQLTQQNTFVLKEDEGEYTDSETVKQMINLCSNAQIHFTYPSELYWEDFNKYLAGEISLDEFITEADRKLKVYLNE
ncbi:MAG: hypothetical protein ACI4J7_10915 [Ruminiclostridium sp.]